MTPVKLNELAAKLATHGMTVTMTRDHHATMLNLARLAQFERLMVDFGRSDKTGRVADAVETIRLMQRYHAIDCRPLEILDVPVAITEVHRAMHARLDRGDVIHNERLHAAVSAFTAILCAPNQPEATHEG